MRLARQIGQLELWLDSLDREDDEIEPACLADLKTQDGTLSTWRSDNLETANDLPLVLTACNSERVREYAVVHLEEEDLETLNIDFEKTTPGKAPLLPVDHYDLLITTAAQLLQVAELILGYIRNDEFDLIQTNDQVQLLREYVAKGAFEVKQLESKVLQAYFKPELSQLLSVRTTLEPKSRKGRIRLMESQPSIAKGILRRVSSQIFSLEFDNHKHTFDPAQRIPTDLLTIFAASVNS